MTFTANCYGSSGPQGHQKYERKWASNVYPLIQSSSSSNWLFSHIKWVNFAVHLRRPHLSWQLVNKQLRNWWKNGTKWILKSTILWHWTHIFSHRNKRQASSGIVSGRSGPCAKGGYTTKPSFEFYLQNRCINEEADSMAGEIWNGLHNLRYLYVKTYREERGRILCDLIVRLFAFVFRATTVWFKTF